MNYTIFIKCCKIDLKLIKSSTTASTFIIYPSYICLVLFGFAISITAYFPEKEHFTTNDDYWECILNYDQTLSIEDLNERMGRWENLATGVKRWKLVPEFLKEPYRTQLIAIQNEFNETEMDGIS